jgi:hypothetical protein
VSFDFVLQRANCFGRRKGRQLHLATFRCPLHLVHHREDTLGASPHHQAAAIPWNVFFDRERGVAEGIAERLRSLLLALADLATID